MTFNPTFNRAANSGTCVHVVLYFAIMLLLAGCRTPTNITSESKAKSIALHEAEKRGWDRDCTGTHAWFQDGRWWVVLSRLRGHLMEVAGVEVLPNGGTANLLFDYDEAPNFPTPVPKSSWQNISEKEAIHRATQHIVEEYRWSNFRVTNVTYYQEGFWGVTVWRLPAVPCGFTTVKISDQDGQLVRYYQ